MKKLILFTFVLLGASLLWGQGRYHTATEAGTLELIPATQKLRDKPEVSIKTIGESKEIKSNGIPDHKVGKFPNPHNPNEIRPQSQVIKIPANPQVAERVTFMHGPPPAPRVFGVTLDGVFLEPGAGEFWKGNPYWQYEPLNAAVLLGLDENYAHVQPTGKYHHHGMPTLLMKRLGFTEGEHSPLIGWAADGFPIYARYGYSDPQDPDSGIVDLQPTYQLIIGDRPEEPTGPGGKYDGAFIRDYHYVADSGDLDECSGRFCVTPDFPEGTYAYFMTEKWPVIPRAFKGTPTSLEFPTQRGSNRPPRGKGRKGPPPPPRRR